MIWTQAQDDILVTMRDAGETYGVIAHKLGVTRNAISGRVNRLKLKPRDQSFSANVRWHGEGKPEKPAKPKKAPLKPITWRKGVVTGPKFFAIVEAPNTVPVGIMERTGCCYPVTERGPHKFCNAETEGTYCKFHRSVMYKEIAA